MNSVSLRVGRATLVLRVAKYREDAGDMLLDRTMTQAAN